MMSFLSLETKVILPNLQNQFKVREILRNKTIKPNEALRCHEIVAKFLKEFRISLRNEKYMFTPEHSDGYDLDISSRTVYGLPPVTFREMVIFLLACTVLIEPRIQLSKSKQIVTTYLEMENVEDSIISDAFEFYDGIIKEASEY